MGIKDFEDVREWVAENNDEALFADGFEDAVIGICERYGQDPIVAYDREKCIRILVEQIQEDLPKSDDPEEDAFNAFLEAEEYFSYNVIGSWVGENTPVFITRY